MKARQICFGVAVGVALGLLFDGVLLINSSGWLLAFIWPVALPPLLGAAIGVGAGWTGKAPATRWYWSVLIAVLLWPIAGLSPIKIQDWRFRHFTRSLPTYHVADRRIQSLEVLGGDSPPSVRVEFQTKHVGFAQMLRFYRDYFVENGWAEESLHDVYRRDVWYRFRKGRHTVAIIGYEGGKWGDRQCVAVVRNYNTPFYGLGTPPQSVDHQISEVHTAQVSLRAALDMYKLDTGSYPTQEQGLQALTTDPGVEGWKGRYLRAKDNHPPPDPWGHQYRYQLVEGEPQIDSAGPDGKFGTEDDTNRNMRRDQRTTPSTPTQ